MIVRDKPLRVDCLTRNYFFINRRLHDYAVSVSFRLAGKRYRITCPQIFGDKGLVEPDNLDPAGIIGDNGLRNVHAPAETAAVAYEFDLPDDVGTGVRDKIADGRNGAEILVAKRKVIQKIMGSVDAYVFEPFGRGFAYAADLGNV